MQTQQGSTGQPQDHRTVAARYAAEADAAEKMIVDALPAIIGKLIDMAKDGDVKASRYLVDRILGRVPRLGGNPSSTDLIARLPSIKHKEATYPISFRDTTPNRPKSSGAPIPGISSRHDDVPALDAIRQQIERRKAA